MELHLAPARVLFMKSWTTVPDGICWSHLQSSYSISIWRDELSLSLQRLFVNQDYTIQAILTPHLNISLWTNRSYLYGPFWAIWTLNMHCITNQHTPQSCNQCVVNLVKYWSCKGWSWEPNIATSIWLLLMVVIYCLHNWFRFSGWSWRSTAARGGSTLWHG